MNTNIYRPTALLALFAAAVLAAGLMAMVGAKSAWAAEPNFEPAKNYPIGPSLNDLTAADFDGDGKAADLAVATPGSTTADTLGNVAVLSNEGDGTFAAARNVPAGFSPLSVTSADFDRDDKEDLAVANGSNVSISLSNGDDTFQAAKYFPVGSGAIQVTTGHFNDDGAVDFVDLAVASLGSDAVSVLLGNGDGTFRAAKNFEVGDSPMSVTSGDFDGDGKADLATADDPSNPASGNIADSVSVLLGNGDGTFKDARRFSFPVGPDNHANPRQVVSADFDGDGKADLAVANRGGGDIGGSGCCNAGYVRVLVGNGDGTFSEGEYLGNAPGMKRPASLTTADFDRDGIADLAIAQENLSGPGVVAVSLGNGDGTFNEAKPFTTDWYPVFVISEDFNDDDYPDLAVANRQANPRNVSVLLNIPPPGATTSTSGPSGSAGDPQPSFQLASSETSPSLVGNSAAAAGNTTRISVDSSGAQLNASSSSGASISSDGRYVVFASTSPDLVANDSNNFTDLFVRDRQTGTTQRVSVSDSETEATDRSFSPSISADGRYVVFYSRASDLVAGDTNNVTDVFVRDRTAGTTERVSVDSSEIQANDHSSLGDRPSISADGRYVAFSSRASNLATGPDNVAGNDIFVRDRTAGTTERVNRVVTNSTESRSSISADGRFVAWISSAPMVADDTNIGPGRGSDVYVRDRQSGGIIRVSVDSAGRQASEGGACQDAFCNYKTDVSISSNGRFVAWNSSAPDLVAGDTNGIDDIFVRDRDTDEDGVFDESGAVSTERANVAGCSTQANHGSYDPFISPDGRYVTFTSQSTNLVEGDTNVSPDFFVRDRQAGTTQRVSVGSSGTQSHLGGGGSSISSDGRFAVFSSQALDLVANDSNGFTDVFLREMGDAPPQLGDCIAPTSTASASTVSGATYTPGTWTREDVTVSLSARDNEGGSGVKEITYSINGGANQTYNPTSKIPVTAEGTNTVSFFATDNAGNQETPVKTFTAKIDKSAPDTTITSGPSGTVSSTSASFAFSSSEAGSTFECKLDGADFASCTSPKSYSGLVEGSHTFQVRATDTAGNTDANAASLTWTVAALPDTSITSGPSGDVKSTFASFSFSSPEAASTFQCSRDGASFTVCTSPKSYSSLSQGNHAFRVRAIDKDGNVDPTPASRSWFVDTVVPKGTISINGGASSTSSRSVTLRLSASDPSPASGVASMRFRSGGTTTWSSWFDYSTSVPWTLTAGAGTKTVYVQYQDRAGNNSTTASDTIRFSP
jgi:hypothetical protein